MILRIKTEKEFEKEFGLDWRNNIYYGWLSPNMDEFFGQLFDCDRSRTVWRKTNSFGHHFGITWDMLIEDKPEIPNYKPRKIRREL